MDHLTGTNASQHIGQNICPLDDQWIYDLITLQKHEADEMKKIEEEEEERREEQRYSNVQDLRHPDFG